MKWGWSQAAAAAAAGKQLCSWKQTAEWRWSETLWTQCSSFVPKNPSASGASHCYPAATNSHLCSVKHCATYNWFPAVGDQTQRSWQPLCLDATGAVATRLCVPPATPAPNPSRIDLEAERFVWKCHPQKANPASVFGLFVFHVESLPTW